MNIQSLLTRRNIFIISITLGLLVVGVFIWLTLTGPTVQKFNIAPLPILKPVAVDSKGDDLVFSNGRAFVSLNLTTSETKTLASAQLPNISKLLLDPNKNAALFQTYNHTADDVLASKLDALGLPYNQAYWWYTDFATNTFRLVLNSQGKAASFITAQWLSDGGFAASDNANITVYTQNLTIKHSYGYPNLIANYSVTPDNKVRTVSDNKLIENTLGTADNPTVLLENVSGAAFSPDGEWAYISSNSDNQEEVPVALFNIKDKKKYFETTAHEPAPTWSKDSSTLFIPAETSRGADFTFIKAISIKDMREHFIEGNGPRVGFKYVTFAKDANTFIGEVSASDSFYLASTHAPIKGTGVENFKKTDFDDNKSSLEYFSSEFGYFIATIYGADTPENREKPLKILRDQGINPDLVQIIYSFYETNKGRINN